MTRFCFLYMKNNLQFLYIKKISSQFLVQNRPFLELRKGCFVTVSLLRVKSPSDLFGLTQSTSTMQIAWWAWRTQASHASNRKYQETNIITQLRVIGADTICNQRDFNERINWTHTWNHTFFLEWQSDSHSDFYNMGSPLLNCHSFETYEFGIPPMSW